MTDIVKRLRRWCSEIRRHPAVLTAAEPLVQQAADEIDSLRGLLREARGSIDWGAPDFQLLIDRIDAVLAADSAAPVHSHCGKPLKVANGCCVWCGYSDAETVAAVEGEK